MACTTLALGAVHPPSPIASARQAARSDGDWTAYGRDAGGERFSPLDGIRRENVASLTVAWTFRTGDAYQPKEGRATAFEATPLHVDGTLYFSTPVGRVIALDPVTGQQRWAFDARAPRDMGYGDFASRGVSTWQRAGERRIFVATIDARLIALDAKTGKPIPGFGEQGTVDLRKGLRIPPQDFSDYEVTSPPAVIGNTIVVGSAIADGTSKPHPSGEVRGFDAITGKLQWTWDPVPQGPTAPGADTWKNNSAARAGSANAWSVIAADPARNLVFVPTSSPTDDYYGGERAGHNLFANSIVALRADTGALVWHFQTVHHDLWDYDVASPPILFDWRKDGQTIAAVAVAPKTAQLFILDRETGKPLIPVEERSVPKSDVPGEVAAPTQPFPAAPQSLARTTLSAKDAWGVTEDDREWCRKTMSGLRSDGLFTPPSLTGTLVIPGNVGGMAWGGIAHDRVNDLLIMPVNNLAAEVRLIARGSVESERKAGRLSGQFEFQPQRATPYGVVRRFLLGPKTALPCTPPPWGTLTAVKASTGEMAWQVPLGQLPWAEKMPDAARWGSIALGGPIVTAGGLVFTAGTLDAAIYAFDVASGKQLWKGTLPTSARATPMTYLGRDGRQYVVIAAGGHGIPEGLPLGDHLVAFALPRNDQPGGQRSLALSGGRIYRSPEAAPIDDGVVLVRSGRIEAVGPRATVAIPEGVRTLDCKGLAIVAGFQNSHVHFTDPARWADAASKPADRLSADLRDMVTRYGFTTIVDTASDLANTLALRRRIESGEVSGPRILTAGSALYPADGVPYYVRDVLPPEIARALPQPFEANEAARTVRHQLSAGADIVKLFTGSWVERGKVKPMDPGIATAAAREAHRLGKLVFSHASNVAGLEVAIRSGVDVLAHALDDTRGLTQAHLERMRRANMAVVPTLALFRGDPDVVDEVREFARLGGDILFGTDTGYLPNFDTAEEFTLMAAAGLGWREVLASLTTTPARRFGEASARGRVAPGMAADLVVLGHSPQAGVLDAGSFSRVRYTIRGGQIIYAATDAPDATTILELKNMQQRLAHALLARQRAEYASMLAPEWRVAHIDGRVMTKVEVLEMVFGPPEPPFREALEDDVEVRLLGDDAAVVTGRSSFTLRDGSRIVLRFTDVVHRRDGRWLIVSSHASPVARPQH